MKKIILIISLFLSNFSFCQISKFAIDTKEYKEVKVEHFNKINVNDKINVQIIIVKDEENQKVELNSTQKDVDVLKMDVSVEDNELNIKVPFFSSISGEKVSVRIYTPAYKIENIVASSSAKIVSKDIITSKNKLEISAYSSATIDLNVDVNELKLKASTGGIIRLTGKTKKQDIQISTASHYYGKELISEQTNLEMILGGDADVYATESLKIESSSAGSVNYYGSPKIKDLKGGSIKEIK